MTTLQQIALVHVIHLLDEVKIERQYEMSGGGPEQPDEEGRCRYEKAVDNKNTARIWLRAIADDGLRDLDK